MRSLVTGGAGFIGSNLVDALLGRGDEVTVLDDLSTGRLANLDGALAAGARLVELDVRDAAAVAAAVAEARPVRIYHLAAQIDVRKSIADPAFDAGVNVGGTANLLEAARALGDDGDGAETASGGAQGPRFVLVSTGGAIYGEGAGRRLPLPEATEIAPLSPYGQSKFAAEGYVSLYERLYRLSGISLRLGNVYGPRQDPLGEAGVIAIFCGKLRGSGRPTVFGDGRQTRDYIYVGDVVAALLAAGESDARGAFNIGTGIETDVLELIEGLRAADDGAAAGFEPEFAPERTGEVQAISVDPARAAAELGWRAEVGLREGLALTLAAT
ncbi:MAG TPA: GDP-mannose 4,6-dehydratase [Solirubrobacterales bacterium]|nr:GDP-mannose 4,6-dehydratase [Solirubrobacterales bacterium]